MTNPVARLAALLQQAISTHGKHWKRAAEYLEARGVQYAPRGSDALHDAGDWLWHLYMGVGKEGRPPLPTEWDAAWEALHVALKREAPAPLRVIDEVHPWPNNWRSPMQELGARGRPEGPSAPPGPWVVEEGLTEGEFRVGLPANEVAYERVYDFRTGAEARAVCDALNRVGGSRPPEGT